MKSRILFVASLGISLIIHVLLLLGPRWNVSREDSQKESYQVRLIQKTEAIDRQDLSTVLEEPKLDTEVIATQADNRADKLEPEYELKSVDQMNQEPRSTDPQLQFQKNREPEKEQVEIETGIPAKPVRSRPAEAVQVLQQEESTDYQRVLHDLRRLVQKSLYYPEVARRKGIEGALAIQFTLKTDGHAEDMVIFMSSDSRILDRAALRSIAAIFPYPDPPEAPLHFTVPVTYRLRKQK